MPSTGRAVLSFDVVDGRGEEHVVTQFEPIVVYWSGKDRSPLEDATRPFYELEDGEPVAPLLRGGFVVVASGEILRPACALQSKCRVLECACSCQVESHERTI